MTKERAEKLRAVISGAMQLVDDETAVENISLYPEWEVGKSYTVNFKVQYNGVLYKVLQAHTSQSDWTPDVAVSLFAKVLIPDPDVIPVWEQPDSTNPYMRGDKVHYPDENSPVYESLIDSNVWSPDAYPAGWQIVGA